MAESEIEYAQVAEAALQDDALLVGFVDDLEDASRRKRQHAACALSAVAKIDPSKLAPFASKLIEALEKSEAQTRWECLDALTCLADVNPQACKNAIPGADLALFDETNGLVRLAAMRFLCKFGSLNEENSVMVWPLIDEAIQCYHGDQEFLEMLLAVIEFSTGKISKTVKEGLKSRMKFDAEGAKGTLGKRAQQIVNNLK